jgi:hypothetical protein
LRKRSDAQGLPAQDDGKFDGFIDKRAQISQKTAFNRRSGFVVLTENHLKLTFK